MRSRRACTLSAAVSLLGVAALAMPAKAATYPAIQMSDDSGNLITVDSTGSVTTGGACTPASCVTVSTAGPGNVNWSGTIGNLTFTVTGTYQLFGTPAVVPFMDVNVSSLTSAAPATLTLAMTNTNISAAPVYSMNVISTTGPGVNSASYQTFVDPSNAPFSTTGAAVLLGSIGTAGGATEDLSGPSGSSVSFTNQIVVSVQGGAAYSNDFFVTASPYVLSSCSVINAIQNAAISEVQLNATGGIGPYTFSASGLPPGLQLSPDGILSGTPTQSGAKIPYTVTMMDLGDNNNVSTSSCTLTVQAPARPGIKLTKTASAASVAPYTLVTYTYTVTNTGGVTLYNIVVKDDNATPSDASDDYVVGTVASLAPGGSATLTWTTYPTMETVVVDKNLGAIPGGSLAIQSVPGKGCTPNVNCPLKFILNQSTNLNDNSYGSNSSSGWGKTHNFSDLLGSDSAQFAFYDSRGNMVLKVSEDYISSSNGPLSSCPNPNWSNYSSGYGTLGWCGGGGNFSSGSSNYVVGETTTLTDNLNQPQFRYGYTNNSPRQGTPGWNFTNGYTIIINPSVFGSYGFGSVQIPNVHNSPSKNGSNSVCHTPTSSNSTNTATATDSTGLTASASATVKIVSNIAPASTGAYQAPSAPPIVAKWPGGANGTAGTPFSLTLIVSGGKPNYTCALANGSLPAGLTLNSSKCTIAGTPASSGSSTVTLGITDSGNPPAKTTVTGTIYIAAAAPLTTSCDSGASGNVGAPFNFTFPVKGGIGPYTYAEQGALPQGVTFSTSTGSFSGIPTAAFSGYVTVTAKDSESPAKSVSATFRISIGAEAPLSLQEPWLIGQANETFHAQLQASGGAYPYTYSVAYGNLPQGLTLNPSTGLISGTPSQSAFASVSFQVQDSQGHKVTKTGVFIIGR